jgi:hypothetical protein
MIAYLKKAIEQKAGFPLDSVSACRKLEKILYANGLLVSYSTLNRLFSENRLPSKSRTETLNLLSRFAGYPGFQQFEREQLNLSIQQEAYLSNELTIKALLFNNDFKTAIDLYVDVLREFPEFMPEISNVIGNSIYNDAKFKPQHLQYLLNRERTPPYFMESFVLEDDLNGLYTWSINNLDYRFKFEAEKSTFASLFQKRKEYLQGNFPDLNYPETHNLNYHLLSRFYELELLEKHFRQSAPLKEFVHERTHTILDALSASNCEHHKLAFVGRWCRALLYTRTYPYLKDHLRWKECCLVAFFVNYENLEFKAPIFTSLQLNFPDKLPFEFYWNNRWETARLESELILALRFQKKLTINRYKKALNFKISI